ncbi:glutathione S-transferase [Schizophyllum commune H4-8]|uniref:glutathione S-transferase n=1 Tax=Schizophyllum commune (strain H4-8 / FGSC 9210) TaxID=578458 RepID=UPI00215EC8A1|nr:glutathione S-transferase [Schizophyllum commune H4-8]KAI5886100.1 glutathione S-transferase [Schizophyllum commune H4-8]
MTVMLYGSDLSSTTLSVALVLWESNVPFEYVYIDMTKYEHKMPEYKEKQPFGCVPTTTASLFESRAICRYLCRKYAGRGGRALFPFDDLRAFARAEQGCSIETTTFDRACLAIFTERVHKQWQGLPGDGELYKQAETLLAQKLDVYEKILGNQRFMGDDTFTLADLFHVPYASRLKRMSGCDFLESGRWPNVTRWYNEITSRPSFQANEDGVKAYSQLLMSCYFSVFGMVRVDTVALIGGYCRLSTIDSLHVTRYAVKLLW